MTFFQTAPVLSNLYQQDFALQAELKRRLPGNWERMYAKFDQMGYAAAQVSFVLLSLCMFVANY